MFGAFTGLLVSLFFLSAFSSAATLLDLAVANDGPRSTASWWLITIVVCIVVLAATIAKFVALELATDSSRLRHVRLTAGAMALSLMMISTFLGAFFFWTIMSQREAYQAELEELNQSILYPLVDKAARYRAANQALRDAVASAWAKERIEIAQGGTCGVGSSIGTGPAVRQRAEIAARVAALSPRLGDEAVAFSGQVAALRAITAQALDPSSSLTAQNLKDSQRRLIAGARSTEAIFLAGTGSRAQMADELEGLARQLEVPLGRPACLDPVLATSFRLVKSHLDQLKGPLPIIARVKQVSPISEFSARLTGLLLGSARGLPSSAIIVPLVTGAMVDVAIALLAIGRVRSSASAARSRSSSQPAQLRLALEGRAAEVLRALLKEDLVKLGRDAFFALPVPPDGATKALQDEFSDKLAAIRLLSTSSLVQSVDIRSISARVQNWVFAVTRVPVGPYARVKLELAATGRGGARLDEVIVARIAPEALASLVELTAVEDSSEVVASSTANAAVPRHHGEIRSSDIFISYSSRERAVASTFAEALLAEGFSVWWDPNLYPGETFDDIIQAHLAAATAVLVLWSARSVTSRWVRSEATFGLNKDVLVPAQIEDCELPIAFLLIQTINLNGWRGDRMDPRWRSLVDAFKVILSLPDRRPPAGPPRRRVSEEIELAFWASVKDSPDPEELRAYLRAHPDGHFGELAQVRLRKLAGTGRRRKKP